MTQGDSERLLMVEVLEGRISRRDLVRRSAILGLSAPVIASMLAACAEDEDDEDEPAVDPDDDEDEVVDEDDEDVDPDDDEPVDEDDAVDEEPVSDRGGGGRLNLLWWQAPDIINPHLSQGTKDFDACAVVYEALANTVDDGTLVPRLAAEIPSVEAGTVDADGMWVTWSLRQDVVWQDGEPFTAHDVRFTYDYIMDEATTATTIGTYTNVTDVEVVDDYTVTVHFEGTTPGWFIPFVGEFGMIIPEHIFGEYSGERAREAPANLDPVGTGAFICTDFRAGDTSFYELNPNYYEDGKPYFDSIELKGGGDATSAARAVVVTGEADYAWNIQVEADVLTAMESQGDQGFIHSYPSTGAEMVLMNFADNLTEVNGHFSEPETEHRYLGNQLIRQAIQVSIERDVIAEQLYGAGGEPTAHALNAPAWVLHPDLDWEFDLDKARDLLDEAGAVDDDGDGVREYNGHRLDMLYVTSINPVRQKQQEITKDALEEIGFSVDLKAVDAAVFFSSDAGNPDTYAHFYADIQMYTHTVGNTYPIDWVVQWASWEIASSENNWARQNIFRYANDEMDETIQQAQVELDRDEQARLFQHMNWIVNRDVVAIGTVLRAGVAAVANDLEGYFPGAFRSDLWDLKEWRRPS